jgi:hypothetical protein
MSWSAPDSLGFRQPLQISAVAFAPYRAAPIDFMAALGFQRR